MPKYIDLSAHVELKAEELLGKKPQQEEEEKEKETKEGKEGEDKEAEKV